MFRSTPHPPQAQGTSISPFSVNPDINIEDALILASEYLSCAAATAYESADNSKTEFRPLARAVVHQIEAARALVEASVAELEVRQKAI